MFCYTLYTLDLLLHQELSHFSTIFLARVRIVLVEPSYNYYHLHSVDLIAHIHDDKYVSYRCSF